MKIDEIRFLKDSPDGQFKKGDEVSAKKMHWRANYWIKTGVAEKVENKERKTSKKSEDKNAAPKTESKSKKK